MMLEEKMHAKEAEMNKIQAKSKVNNPIQVIDICFTWAKLTFLVWISGYWMSSIFFAVDLLRAIPSIFILRAEACMLYVNLNGVMIQKLA